VTLLGDMVEPVAIAVAFQEGQTDEDCGAGRDDGQRPQHGPAGMHRVDGQGECDDAGGVGDRHLGEQRQHLLAVKVQRVDDGQDQQG